jgi:hypothetical protein
MTTRNGMKIRMSIKIATLAALGALGLTLGGLFSFAGSGTFFTYVDNENNAGTGVADGDMATTSLITEPAPATLGASNPLAPIEFNISVATLPTQSASLTIRGWDIDEEQGEQDDVYLNGVLLGKLTGANSVWSTTVFEITNLSLLQPGNNRVEIRIDTSGDATNWVTAVRWGQLLVDGGAADRASTGSVVITGCQTRVATVAGCTVNGAVAANTVRIDSQATVNVVDAGNYRLEVTIIDPGRQLDDGAHRQFRGRGQQHRRPHGLADVSARQRQRHLPRAVAALLRRLEQLPDPAGRRDQLVRAHAGRGPDRPRRRRPHPGPGSGSRHRPAESRQRRRR